MQATVKWTGGAGFAAESGSGHTVQMDGPPDHGGENRVRDINSREAIERLLPVTSIPWYDKEVIPEMLDLCEELISSVPVYELYFKPGVEVIDVFEKFISSEINSL